jgi:hypothetical protein
MKVKTAMLMVLAAAVTLTSVAVAVPEATKQRVEITMAFHDKKFVLAPLQPGALKRDSGTIAESAEDRWTLTGKRGTLTIRTPAEWRDGGSPGNCGVAFGNWTVVRGTGTYAAITGRGKSAYDAHCDKWYARHEGFLTAK